MTGFFYYQKESFPKKWKIKHKEKFEENMTTTNNTFVRLKYDCPKDAVNL